MRSSMRLHSNSVPLFRAASRHRAPAPPRAATTTSPEAEPFEVMSIYSFAGGKCSRVEFVR